MGVTANNKSTTGWRTVLTNKPILPGEKRTWEVVIEQCTANSNIMIGVCEKKTKVVLIYWTTYHCPGMVILWCRYRIYTP